MVSVFFLREGWYIWYIWVYVCVWVCENGGYANIATLIGKVMINHSFRGTDGYRIPHFQSNQYYGLMAISLYPKRFPLNQSIEWTCVCNIDTVRCIMELVVMVMMVIMIMTMMHWVKAIRKFCRKKPRVVLARTLLWFWADFGLMKMNLPFQNSQTNEVRPKRVNSRSTPLHLPDLSIDKAQEQHRGLILGQETALADPLRDLLSRLDQKWRLLTSQNWNLTIQTLQWLNQCIVNSGVSESLEWQSPIHCHILPFVIGKIGSLGQTWNGPIFTGLMFVWPILCEYGFVWKWGIPPIIAI